MTSSPAAPPAPSAWAPLARPTFRSLWLAQLGSNVGVWMQNVGAQWFLVEQAHSSALVAWVQTASLLPTLLLSLLAGVFADQYDRRILLVVTNGAATVIAGVLTILGYAGALSPWGLLVFTFLLGCASALTGPAWQAIQPELVPRSELASASALGSVTVNAARAIGPAIAGFLVALTGPSLVFLLNAISFVLVIVALLAWRRETSPAGTGRERLGPALVAGLRYVANGPIVRRILLRSALFALPGSALWALLPEAAQAPLGLNASGYGLLLAVLGAGALVGVALMPVIRRRLPSGVTLAGSALVFGLGSLSVVIWPLAAVLPLLLLAGIAWIATLTTLNANMQLTLPAWVRARGMAAYLLVFMGTQAIGSFLWGAVSAWIGTGPTLIAAAALLALTAASVPLWPLPAEVGTLDRSIVAMCLPTPALVFDPEPEDGPVLVVRTYAVPPENAGAFASAMRLVEQTQRRTGATSWRLYRSGEHAGEYREEFTVRSWSEFQRQTTERWTGYDRERWDAAVALAATPPAEEHFFASPSR
ncbi:MFS transporter [Gryllotalpicola reticulitermitis]|uniref:MFS transporter n=1 Tax=Gryllotalpicola reticulitermitis TaxID=1184153 RepID=A0ABV8Q6I2_9MICO